MKTVVFKFPSGKVVELEIYAVPSVHSDSPPPRRPTPRKRACKHVGAQLEVSTGCGGMSRYGIWECGIHGKCAPMVVLQSEQPHAVACSMCDDYEPAAEPGLVRLGLNVATAVTKWIRAGMPVRSPEQIKQVYAICRRCPFMARTKQGATYCAKCGCPVNEQPQVMTTKMTNKIAMATESCPLDEPQWVAEAPNPIEASHTLE